MPLYFSKLSLKAPELLKIIHINKHVNNIMSESTELYQYKSCFFVLQCQNSLKYKITIYTISYRYQIVYNNWPMI